MNWIQVTIVVPAKAGPIRRGGCSRNNVVDDFVSTIAACGYGSLLSQGRQQWCDKINTTGKSLLIFRNRVKPRKQKYSAGHVGQITGLILRIPAHTRGASRSSRNVGPGMRWTLWRQACYALDETPKRTAKSCGPGAAMLASSLWSDLQATVAKKPAHRGEHEVSRKAIAQGMSECFRSPVCSCAPNAQFLAHETAGAARTRHSLRPLFREGQRI